MGDAKYTYHGTPQSYHYTPAHFSETRSHSLHEHSLEDGIEELEAQERRNMTTLEKLQNSQCVLDIVFGVGLVLIIGLNLFFYVWITVSL